MGRVLRGQAWHQKHKKERKKGDAWRAYLKGEYPIRNRGQLDKMHFDIRRIAKQRIEDLLLIATSEVLPERQRILIFRDFRNKEYWLGKVRKLTWTLQNLSGVLQPEDDEELRVLARSLEFAGIPYDLVDLVTQKYTRDKMKEELEKRGYHLEPEAQERTLPEAETETYILVRKTRRQKKLSSST